MNDRTNEATKQRTAMICATQSFKFHLLEEKRYTDKKKKIECGKVKNRVGKERDVKREKRSD